MKKAYYLLLFVLTLSAAANAQTDWVTKNLDDKLSIKFPAEPEKVGGKGIDVYAAKGKDSIAYTVNVIDLYAVAHLDSTILASMKDSQGFADQMKMGMASKMGNYTLGDVAIGKWKTYTTYTITGTDNTTKGKISMLMIIIGSKIYTLACMIPANLATKNDEVFFGSMELVKK